jgi:hypothetical protein
LTDDSTARTDLIIDPGSTSGATSSTTPAAPPMIAPAAVCGPMPPHNHTGSDSPAICCSSTNEPRSLARPPASAPRAITPSAPISAASRASPSEVTSTSTQHRFGTSETCHGESQSSTTMST